MSLLTNLIAYYKFDETSGSILHESTGNGPNGNWQGTLGNQWKPGKINNAGNFNATDNYIDLGSTLSVESTNKLTLAAWVFVTTFNSYNAAIYTNNWNGWILQTLINGDIGAGHVRFLADDGSGTGQVNSTNPISLNTWAHLVGTFDGSNYVLYINGSQDATATHTKTIIDHNINKLIGSANGVDQMFNGMIDEVGIWSRVLSASEVSQLYNSGNGLQYPFGISLRTLVNSRLLTSSRSLATRSLTSSRSLVLP